MVPCAQSGAPTWSPPLHSPALALTGRVHNGADSSRVPAAPPPGICMGPLLWGAFTRPHILRVVPPCPELSMTCPSHRCLFAHPVCLSYYCFICCLCLDYSQLLKSGDLAHLLMLLYL